PVGARPTLPPESQPARVPPLAWPLPAWSAGYLLLGLSSSRRVRYAVHRCRVEPALGGSSRGRTPGSGPGSGGSNPPPPASSKGARPHRLEAQDTALSRLKHGFESRWGHQCRWTAIRCTESRPSGSDSLVGPPRGTPHTARGGHSARAAAAAAPLAIARREPCARWRPARSGAP